jgi:hypothetical protein
MWQRILKNFGFLGELNKPKQRHRAPRRHLVGPNQHRWQRQQRDTPTQAAQGTATPNGRPATTPTQPRSNRWVQTGRLTTHYCGPGTRTPSLPGLTPGRVGPHSTRRWLRGASGGEAAIPGKAVGRASFLPESSLGSFQLRQIYPICGCAVISPACARG